MIFLTLRAFVHTKVKVGDEPQRKQLPNLDTIIAIKQVVNVFNSQWVPALIYFGILVVFDVNVKHIVMLKVLALCNSVSVVTITFMIFVHWKKGSDWWLKISKPAMYFLLLVNYFGVPLFCITIQVLVLMAPSIRRFNLVVESFFLFYNVMMVLRIIEYFTFIRPYVIGEAKHYCETYGIFKDLTVEQLEANLQQEEESEDSPFH